MPRIVTFEQYGGPEVLNIVDVDVPPPAPHEVQITVKAIGVNRAESMWRTGVYVEPVNLPARLGYEVSGVISAVGANVTTLAPGDIVSTLPAFSQNDYGLYGEVVNAPAHAVVKHTPTLSFQQAVATWNVFITAYGAFAESKLLSPGQVVLIPAASSAVGLGAIQIVKMLGGIPVALTRRSGKAEQLRAIGAAHVIATEEQDLLAEVNRITAGKGADFIFDPVGGARFNDMVEAIAPGGTIFVYGALAEEETTLPLLRIVLKQPNIRGFNVFGITMDAQRQQAAVDFILGGLERGELKTVIAKQFAFNDIVEAHRYLEKNQHIGKVVVNVGA